MKPTLLLLAAGMGSRYGGLKQLDGLGPNGETIMDYSIYDAIQSGFGKIVFVIRKDFENEFRTKILSKYEGRQLGTGVREVPETIPKYVLKRLSVAYRTALMAGVSLQNATVRRPDYAKHRISVLFQQFPSCCVSA